MAESRRKKGYLKLIAAETAISESKRRSRHAWLLAKSISSVGTHFRFGAPLLRIYKRNAMLEYMAVTLRKRWCAGKRMFGEKQEFATPRKVVLLLVLEEQTVGSSGALTYGAS